MTERFNGKIKKVFSTIIYPKIERRVEDFYIDIIQEDRLDNLAYQYYEDVTLWWVIANGNKLDRASQYGITKSMKEGIGKGSMYVKPGQRIRIPHPDRIPEIIDDYNKMLEERNI
jgi:hypothetical protein